MHRLGLNPDSLTIQQASDIISKFYKDQEKRNTVSKPAMSMQEKEDELDKLLGRKPDIEINSMCISVTSRI